MSAKDLIFTILGVDKTSDVLDKVGDSFNDLASKGSSSIKALAASSVAGAAVAAGAITALPLMFAGIGAAALRENALVRGAFADLGNEVRTGLAQDAQPMAATFVDSAEQIRGAFRDLRPELREGFVAAKPHVEALTRGVTTFAREAVPGMVSGVKKAGPVFKGLESFLGDAGRGLGDFFEIVSDGAPGAGAFFEDLGNLTRDVLPSVAEDVVMLTEVWEEHGDQAVRVVADLVDVVGELGSSAMPIASTAMGYGLDVLEGILAVIGPMADQLGPLIGIWMALSVAMRAIGATRGVIDNVSTSVANLREKAGTAAGPTGLAKVQAVASGLLGVLGGPWGLALTAATIGLAMYGQKSQDAANDQRSLAGALKESAGAFDANARSAILNSEQYKDMRDNVRAAGFTHSELIDAVSRGGSEWDRFKSRVQAVIDAETKYSDNGEAAIVVTSEKGKAAGFLSGQLDDLRNVVSGAEDDFRDEQQAIRGSTDAMNSAVPGSDALREALKVLGKTTAETTERADALNRAWKIMFGEQIGLEEATADYLQGMADLREQIDDTKESVGDWRGALVSADGQINTSTEQGRSLLGNLTQQGDAYRTLAQTAYDTALRQTGSQELATAAAQRAVDERRGQFMAEMQAMGFTEGQARRLADTYLGMPKDVMTFLKLLGVTDFEQQIANMTRDRIVKIVVKSSGASQPYNAAGQPVGMPFINDGGLVPGSGPDRDSVHAMLTPGEFVIKRSAARRHLPLLERINRAGGGAARLDPTDPAELDASAGGAVDDAIGRAFAVPIGSGPAAPTVLELRSSGSDLDNLLLSILQRSIRVRGGDVQLVLGGR
jgi:hypothetical protein